MEFTFLVGSKTGDALSAMLLIIILHKSIKDKHQVAIVNHKAQDEKKISSLRLKNLDYVYGQTNMPIFMKGGQQIVSTKAKMIIHRSIDSKEIKILALHEAFTYLKKRLRVAGEPNDIVRNIIAEYTEILEIIADSVLHLALNMEALDIKELSKIGLIFPSTIYSEENLAKVDKT